MKTTHHIPYTILHDDQIWQLRLTIQDDREHLMINECVNEVLKIFFANETAVDWEQKEREYLCFGKVRLPDGKQVLTDIAWEPDE